jgi:nitroreductase
MSTHQSLPADIENLRRLRQTRKFTSEPVAEEALDAILQVARWSGSSKNSQPWEFLVVRDPDRIARIAALGAYSGFLKNAPLVIVLVLHGKSVRSEAYDEGRVSERIMLAAQALGLGSGTGWWGSEDASAAVKQELGVPEGKHVYSGVAIGHPAEASTPAASVSGGRKPLTDLVHYETYGTKSR